MSVSLADIAKALKKLDNKDEPVNLAELIPQEILQAYPRLFSPAEASQLPPQRPGYDHEINLVRDQHGNEPTLPWGPLYSMSREELMVLRKILNDLLDKGFIRASSSSAAAPVLLVKKPGGGVRFCCDYRALNAITRRDRYPLPLITETLRILAGAKWFTKLDVVAAFHKIRIKRGHEAKTAFRTRFGSYEWLVTPFGLTGAPATFQRYINSALQEYLDQFVTAYVDDVLIYTDGTRKEHMAKVQLVLKALEKAGLHLDPKKCEFAVQEVKYLGFIVRAGEGVACDPEKQRAIREWAAPSTVKGVQSFVGFANYYRVFIPDFSKIARPLTRLCKKGVPFLWGPSEEAAFQELKDRFVNAPVLAEFDPLRKTYLETDSSGNASGGVLAQSDSQGRLRPVAFFSRRHDPAEYNYPIHDKEMLAIIRCLEAWRSELRSCGHFTILTDHKNLRYFMTKRMLTERQSRWAGEIAEFNFSLEYRPGSQAVAPDALSRREQDIPQGAEDEREQGRYLQLIPTSALPRVAKGEEDPSEVAEGTLPARAVFPEHPELEHLWQTTLPEDKIYKEALAAVQRRDRSFHPSLKLKVQIAECGIDHAGRLTYRDKLWIPGGDGTDERSEQEKDALRTRIVQAEHDAFTAGHPGRDGTIALVRRRFFWPGARSSSVALRLTATYAGGAQSGGS
ncbi:hypothetical protein LRP88_07349 [Fusarium phalaenopsidis]